MNKISLNSNQLKIIAIITMIIDHIGYYFSFILTDYMYITFRIIGRISMPIFVFLIIQGYFHTKNFKKYIFRIFTLAVVTQGLLLLVGYINYKLVPQYVININNELNILFSLGLILIIINIVDHFNKNIIVNTIYILTIITIYFIVPIDYGVISLTMAICFYLIQKFKKDITINKFIIVMSIIFISLLVGDLYNYMILSIPFILLYNNKLGIKYKNSKFLEFSIFPIQHVILYILGMVIFVI
ncbi:MAG: TraX family protein [Clostridia bacterium]|nr:TraX family protein [Clostridia bacterium]MDD4386374.1 TraX family protein [Clostridia bacterium]